MWDADAILDSEMADAEVCISENCRYCIEPFPCVSNRLASKIVFLVDPSLPDCLPDYVKIESFCVHPYYFSEACQAYDANGCSSCAAGYHLRGKRCVVSSCSAPNCLECAGGGCAVCVEQYSVIDGWCEPTKVVDGCARGSGLLDGVCVRNVCLDPNCVLCDQQGACLECHRLFYLLYGYCYALACAPDLLICEPGLNLFVCKSGQIVARGQACADRQWCLDRNCERCLGEVCVECAFGFVQDTNGLCLERLASEEPQIAEDEREESY